MTGSGFRGGLLQDGHVPAVGSRCIYSSFMTDSGFRGALFQGGHVLR